VGIIVPYRNQIALVARLMAENGLDGFDETVADTVERYQGSQRDIIIFLFTVHQPFGLHFLSASTYLESADSETPYPVDRKLNVTLTRAREQIILIGHAPLLRRNAIYRQLLTEVRKNGGYLDASAISFGE
jgi:DNA replication ATP-dependent helicase Dna2